MQEMEEIQYIDGGQVPVMMRAHYKRKEHEISILKRLFIQSTRSVEDI